MPSTRITVGATNAPPPGTRPSFRTQPSARAASTWALIAAAAPASITGPTSVERSQGSPAAIASIAPDSISSTPSATTSCT